MERVPHGSAPAHPGGSSHPAGVSPRVIPVVAWLLAACLEGDAVLRQSIGSPVPPDEAAARLAVPEDLEVSLFAGEPLLASPSDIDVDARGRVWVCEVTNYRGKKDTRPAGDRILVLEDTDGDGRADNQTVFHQGRDIDSALGICVIGEGAGRKVIVSCAPDVFIFHDDDGDLKADRRESLFTKTGQPQHDHSVHAFVVGPDGRWYFNFGNTGKAVHDAEGKPVKDRFGRVVDDSGHPYRQGMVFRCRPDGGDFEVLGHNFRNNYEVAVDAFGTLWQSDNDDDGNKGVRINYVMEGGNFGYVDERTGAGWQAPRTNLEPEIPLRHWHQNDPGVVPNLLLTGGGSPCGICVYEGTLLPPRFRGALIHCDAGPNVVRSYPVRPQGAGYAATIEAVVDGSSDRWFRPCDVCVAPDGSLLVADWYDPGVGGHGMGDTEKGRIFRVAPKGSRWSVPAADLGSPAGAVAALASPNPCTRATALARLAEEPEAAAAALEAAIGKPAEDRHAARMAWALGMLPGRAAGVIRSLLAANDGSMRIIGLRMAKLVREDVIGVVESLASDPSPAVRRECALALAGHAGERADAAWATLALQHTAGDRWETEALGIGADDQWDGRLAAWMERVGDGWKAPAGREIVWRSRGRRSAESLVRLLEQSGVTTAEGLALVRALDFQDPTAVAAAVREMLERLPADLLDGSLGEKWRVLLPELVMRLEPQDGAIPAVAGWIDRSAGSVPGTPRFVEIVERFSLASRMGELVDLAVSEKAQESVAAAAAGVALERGGDEAIRGRLAAGGPEGLRLCAALGVRGSAKAIAELESLAADADRGLEMRTAAVRGLGRSQSGGRRLVALAADRRIDGGLAQAAAVAIAACPWGDVRQSAAEVLPLPKAKGGGSLPPVADLLRRRGTAERGREVFAGAGTCAKCHLVDGAGRAVGPDLSGIGLKLSPEAFYESILAPSAAISHNYESYTALTADGRSVTGLLISRSPTETILRAADGNDVRLESEGIDELVRQPVSLMPADLATALTADELVDLVAYLQTLRKKE